MNRKYLMGWFFGVFLWITSCSAPSMAQPRSTASLTPAITASPTVIASATFTPTPRPPMLSVSTKVPCRAGPAESYDLVIYLPVAQKFEIVAKTETFWQVKLPDKAECWVANQQVNLVGDVSTISTLAPTVTPEPAVPAAPKHVSLISVTCSIDRTNKKRFRNEFRVTWSDESNNEDGFRIYRDGNMVAEVSANQTDVVDVLIAKNNKPHYYYVISYNALGEAKSDVETFSCGK